MCVCVRAYIHIRICMYLRMHVCMYVHTINRQKFTVKKSLWIAKTANIKCTKVFNRIHCNTWLSCEREYFLTRTFKKLHEL